MGELCRKRIRGDQVENIEQAVFYYEQALEACSRQTDPGLWAAAHNNLTIIYGKRGRGDRAPNLEQAIDLILDELTKLHSEGITSKELRDNQSNFIGRLPLRLESNMGVASALMHLEQYQLGLDYYRRFPDLVAETTLEDAHRAIQRFLNPEHLAIAVAGPLEGKEG